jgi:hypothetical protein
MTSDIFFLQAIDDWVFKTPGLQTLLLNDDEWKTLGEIADVLEVWSTTSSSCLSLILFTVATAVHRGDSTDVTQPSPHNPVCITTLSEDGKAP